MKEMCVIVLPEMDLRLLTAFFPKKKKTFDTYERYQKIILIYCGKWLPEEPGSNV